jgi:hypothetical protein
MSDMVITGLVLMGNTWLGFGAARVASAGPRCRDAAAQARVPTVLVVFAFLPVLFSRFGDRPVQHIDGAAHGSGQLRLSRAADEGSR